MEARMAEQNKLPWWKRPFYFFWAIYKLLTNNKQ